jgi:predicted lipoprotein with Yx(FWY)xxD motif
MNVRILRGTSNRYQVRLIAAALVAVLGLLAAGAGVSSARSTSSVAVKTRKIQGLGVVLVNARGRTLYTYAPDQHRHVTCTGLCAHYWPALKWKGSGKPTAGGAARTKLLGLDSNPSGGRVVTYNHWPLYTYLGDSAAGQANGQDISANGGKWYVITPGGKVIRHK